MIKQHESLHQRCPEMPKNNNNNEPVYALFLQIESHILSKELKQSKQTCMSVHAHTDTHNRTEMKPQNQHKNVYRYSRESYTHLIPCTTHQTSSSIIKFSTATKLTIFITEEPKSILQSH